MKHVAFYAPNQLNEDGQLKLERNRYYVKLVKTQAGEVDMAQSVPFEQRTYDVNISLKGSVEQVINEMRAETGKDYFWIYIDGPYYTQCKTQSGRGIYLVDVPKNHVGEVRFGWHNSFYKIFEGVEEDAKLKYEPEPEPFDLDAWIKEQTGTGDRAKEKAWDEQYNEGGEGYNPSRTVKPSDVRLDGMERDV